MRNWGDARKCHDCGECGFDSCQRSRRESTNHSRYLGQRQCDGGQGIRILLQVLDHGCGRVLEAVELIEHLGELGHFSSYGDFVLSVACRERWGQVAIGKMLVVRRRRARARRSCISSNQSAVWKLNGRMLEGVGIGI